MDGSLSRDRELRIEEASMRHRSLAILITVLSSAPATAADIYVAPGGVYIGGGPVYVTPGPAAPPVGPYAPSGYLAPPQYLAPPPVVAPAPGYVPPPVNGDGVYVPGYRPATVGPQRVYGYGGDYSLNGYAGYAAPRPPAVVPNAPAQCIYHGGLEYCR
jgi:hypothetical protein